jgi:ribosomal protein S4
MRKNVHVLESVESTGSVPDYISLDKNALTATLIRIPERRDIPVPVNEALVVEFYTRLT